MDIFEKTPFPRDPLLPIPKKASFFGGTFLGAIFHFELQNSSGTCYPNLDNWRNNLEHSEWKGFNEPWKAKNSA